MSAMSERAETVERIGPYRLLDELGAGGMGVVYRAEHVETGELVALKTVRAVDPVIVRGIRREIHALRRVRHPGVVRIVDEGVGVDGLPWYAMELIEGATLRHVLGNWWREASRPPRASGAVSDPQPATVPERAQSGTRTVLERRQRVTEPASATEPDTQPDATPATATTRAGDAVLVRSEAAAGQLRDALAIVHALCSALAFIHGEGLVHRDLKPENVMVRTSRAPVLMDFGLVGAFGGAAGRESLEVVAGIEGSFGYISPEQIRAELVDARADLYALGCILYEVVTGRRPFEGEGYALLAQHVLDTPVTPSARVAGVPPALDEVILRLLAKRAADRFGYATDVARALAQIAGLAPDDASVGPAPRTYLYRPEFVGRGDAMAAMDAQLVAAADGVPRFVLLAGESGAGKTRLAAEVAAMAARRDFRVFAGECVPIAGGSHAGGVRSAPLHPLRPVLEGLADQCRAGGPNEAARLLGRSGRVLALYEPSLAELPAVAAQPELPELSPQAARDRLFQLLADTLVELTRDAPVLIVLDDLQWADELTLGLLAWLPGALAAVESHAEARLIVLGTYRSEEATEGLRELGRDARVTTVPLERLDHGTVAQMAGDMLALADPPDAFVGFLTAESAGNPFFIAEYLRAAVEAGLLRRGDAGNWQLTEPAGRGTSFHERLGLPRTLRDLVMRRLEGLAPDAAALLAVASVLGREFDADLLAQTAALPDARELDATQELIRANILEPAGASTGRLRFAHDKLREIAYDRIAPERRAALHRQAAERIEHRGAGHDEALAALYPSLVQHWTAAGDEVRTLFYLERAGEHALRTAASAEAAELLQRALELAHARTITGRGPAPEAHWEARLERMLAEALFATGDLTGCRDHALRALERLGRPLPRTPGEWTRVLVREAARQGAHLLLPSRIAREARGETSATLDAARTASLLSECFYWQQQVVPMVASNLVGMNLAEQIGRAREVRRTYASTGYLVGLARAHGLARRYFDRAQQGEGDPGGVAYGFVLESMYHVVFADWARALATSQRAVDLYGALGDVQQLEIAQTMRAQADYYTGRFALTLPRFAEIRRSARGRANKQHEAWGAYAAARSLIPLGRVDEAVVLLHEALGLLAGLGDRPSEIITQGLLAVAELSRGDFVRARAAADASSELSRGVQPTVYSEGHGYEGAAVVYMAAWSRERSHRRRWFARASHAEAGARASVARLAGFARTYPLARAAALRCRGTLAWLEGHPARAHALWSQSVDAARAAGMPWDQALAHAERARAAPASSALRSVELGEATRLATALGCTGLLAQLAELAR